MAEMGSVCISENISFRLKHNQLINFLKEEDQSPKGTHNVDGELLQW